MKRPDAPTVRQTLAGLRSSLRDAGVESPQAEAERLLAYVLRIDRSRLGLEAGSPFPAGAAPRLARLLARRRSGVPLQHLEGTVAFRDLVLRADGRALIPRPETEQLLDLVARELRSPVATPDAADGVRTVPRPPSPASSSLLPAPAVSRALDVGTGGGAIALALVTEGLAEQVLALDVSEAALEQARENRESVGVDEARLELRLTGTNPFEALGPGEKFDLLVSNPPYVRDDELENLPREVRDHEPRTALAGGPDGLDLLRTLADDARRHLVPGGRVFVEIGTGQGEAAAALFEAFDAWSDICRHPDCTGRERFLAVSRR